MQVMLEAGENFLKVEQVEGADSMPDLLITMDRTKVNPMKNMVYRALCRSGL
jgi:hypothetical protein